jgi:8-oxo-dGTP diphosphatase
VATRDGDGWVLCTKCQSRHWGLHGAAGLLLVRTDIEPASVLLQLRAAWTHGGGTWALPGGALDSHEEPWMGAAREAWEETGIDPEHIQFKMQFTDDHGNWRYDTLIAHTSVDVGAYEANAESDDLRWVPIDEVGPWPTEYMANPHRARQDDSSIAGEYAQKNFVFATGCHGVRSHELRRDVYGFR